MYYALDRTENGIAILENITTGEVKEVKSSLLANLKEGTIYFYEDGVYIADEAYEQRRRQKLQAKLNSLKSLEKK